MENVASTENTAKVSDNLTVTRNGDVISVTSAKGETLRQTQIAARNNPLDGLTLDQALTYIDANVVDLASARTALKHLARIVFVIQAEREREKVGKAVLTPAPSGAPAATDTR